MKYKIIIIIKLILFFNIANAEIYDMEIFFTNKIETLKLSEEDKYLHINSRGVWKDSQGDYGHIKCLGGLLQNKEKSSMDVFCEGINQNKIKFYVKLERDTDRDAGIGYAFYLHGEEKYKKFIGKKCIYASKVFGIDAIVNQRCKFNN